jgi:hypothetical protein
MKDFFSANGNERHGDNAKQLSLDEQEPDTIHNLKATRHNPDDVMLVGPNVSIHRGAEADEECHAALEQHWRAEYTRRDH